jgi:hypothetical protein
LALSPFYSDHSQPCKKADYLPCACDKHVCLDRSYHHSARLFHATACGAVICRRLVTSGIGLRRVARVAAAGHALWADAAECVKLPQGADTCVAAAAGKTLGFGLPALQHILTQRAAQSNSARGPRVLCMAPTRELAQQIAAVLEEAGGAAGVATQCVYGGVPKKMQAAALRTTAPAIVVGTPGRTLDFVEDGTLSLQARFTHTLTHTHATHTRAHAHAHTHGRVARACRT